MLLIGSRFQTARSGCGESFGLCLMGPVAKHSQLEVARSPSGPSCESQSINAALHEEGTNKALDFSIPT